MIRTKSYQKRALSLSVDKAILLAEFIVQIATVKVMKRPVARMCYLLLCIVRIEYHCDTS